MDLCQNIHTSVRQPDAREVSRVLNNTPSNLGGEHRIVMSLRIPRSLLQSLQYDSTHMNRFVGVEHARNHQITSD